MNVPAFTVAPLAARESAASTFALRTASTAPRTGTVPVTVNVGAVVDDVVDVEELVESVVVVVVVVLDVVELVVVLLVVLLVLLVVVVVVDELLVVVVEVEVVPCTTAKVLPTSMLSIAIVPTFAACRRANANGFTVDEDVCAMLVEPSDAGSTHNVVVSVSKSAFMTMR